MSTHDTHGTAELADGSFVKACDVNFITVKEDRETVGVFRVYVTYGNALQWVGPTMKREAAVELAGQINERVNAAMGCKPTVCTKAEPAKVETKQTKKAI